MVFMLSSGVHSRARRPASTLDLQMSAAEQQQWHGVQRDLKRNMYRTAYKDMANNREICVKSDFPVGYGGHVPNLRFDLLHRNTQLDRDAASRQLDPFHDSLPFWAPKQEEQRLTMQSSRSNVDTSRQFPSLLRSGSNPNMVTGKRGSRSSTALLQDARDIQTPLSTSRSCARLRAC
eukprot:TRINITY_DN12646_c1_g1_i1.p1 TRINITY_DN12646_c1_g1~~TRINITY_DN12646_c1_g1_i1.p1  ORF type:complete len:177 (+),score=28.84 TRINITY_DN12646_c1_g1_i1:86-616(+)